MLHRTIEDRLGPVKFRESYDSLYLYTQQHAALVLATCSVALLTVAAFPAQAGHNPVLGTSTVAYAELASLGAIVATIAMLHCRNRGRRTQVALFAATALWWTAALALFPPAPVWALMGMVAVLACVTSVHLTRASVQSRVTVESQRRD